MWAGCVEVTAPALDHNLRLPQAVEDLAVEQFVPKAGVEAFDKAVLPRAAGRDVGRLGADGRDPSLHCLGDEFWPIIRTNMAWHTAQDEKVGEDVDHVDGRQLTTDPDRQALVGEFVDDVEHPELPAVMRPVFDEIVGPDVVSVLWPQPDAGAILQPEASALGLLLGHF